jgi:hypothetical protein
MRFEMNNNHIDVEEVLGFIEENELQVEYANGW